MNRIIKSNYAHPPHPQSFGGISKVGMYYKGKIKQKGVKRTLEGIKSYSLHRERKRPSRNPFFIYFKRKHVQIDLIDVQQLARANDGVRFLLVGIDMFTKFVVVVPMKRKTSVDSIIALKSLLDRFGEKPKDIMSDRGTEFVNKAVLALFKERGIKHILTKSDMKCAGVERVNKTLQNKIYKYMTENNSDRYIDILPEIVSSYNNSTHRTIKMTPKNAEKDENEITVRGHLHSYYFKKRRPPAFSVGDLVRISILGGAFQRSYQESFSREIFIITKANLRMPIPMYMLYSLLEGDDIEGGFYGTELIKVPCLRIKQLKQEMREGGQYSLVKWLDDKNQKESWIPTEIASMKCTK